MLSLRIFGYILVAGQMVCTQEVFSEIFNKYTSTFRVLFLKDMWLRVVRTETMRKEARIRAKNGANLDRGLLLLASDPEVVMLDFGASSCLLGDNCVLG